jgi:hypothetical protein
MAKWQASKSDVSPRKGYIPAIELDLDHDPISWSELSELTHKTQVEKFGFCSCEDNEGNENPYADCPKGNN